ncbi:O-antigen ligase-related protein [Candidatus Omnitrophus magneticus]|uniref:O-antigen ligase-related protein n=1 Tax=Candidatus Omnitrophus magneticus TaxID=1609969 RepID=A0A0F0CUP6_9BACT|nr:O-antigen ligase-related protein [Candidatus Omnitrophus magneticus]
MKLKQTVSIHEILIFFVLFFSPLIFGAVHVWAYSLVSLTVLFLFFTRFTNSTKLFRDVFRISFPKIFLLFLFLNLLYLIPIPSNCLKIINPHVYNLNNEFSLSKLTWETFSIYPNATFRYLMKFTVYWMFTTIIISKIIYAIDTPTLINRHKESINANFIFLGAISGVFSIILHSLCDFNLHIPANAVYFFTLCAIITSISFCKKNNIPISYPFLNKLVNFIIITGFFVAVLGIAQKLGGNGKIYWCVEKQGSHFGPYINYDHFAGFMEMCILLAFACFVSKVSLSSLPHINNLKDKIIWLSSKEANQTLIYLFAAILMTAALFMSTSRGGIMSFSAAFALFSVICAASIDTRRKIRFLLALFFIIIFVVIMILWIGPEETVNRFKLLNVLIKKIIQERSILSELRPHIWVNTIQLIKDFPIFGTGFGTYSYIFPKYRTFSGEYGFLYYAHNDYLHFTSEMGIISVLFVTLFLIWYWLRLQECFKFLQQSLLRKTKKDL